MTEGQRIIDLTEAVAQAYVKNLKYTSEAPKVLQQQVMQVTCGSSSCGMCLTAFEKRWTDPLFFCNDRGCPGDERVKRIQRSLCKHVCLCSLDAFQSSNVVLDSDGTAVQGDINAIVKDTQEILKSKYSDFVPTKAQIESIVGNKLIQNVNQIISTIQVIDISNYGSVKNVNMDTMINGVMKALAETSIQQIRNSVYTYIQSIQPFVQRTISRILNGVWTGFMWYWIGLAILIFVLLLLIFVLAILNRRL